MLQLFGSGLISLWLDMVGLHANPLDMSELSAWQANPGLALTSDPNSSGAIAVQQYLKGLEAKKLAAASQGVWMQSGPIVLANHQGTVPLPAASLTKIATSLAALKTWGPDHQFETLVSATGPVRNGVLQGDLVIQGSGDPFFVWEEAIALGHSLNRLGIKHVTGNLVIAGNFAMNYQPNPLLAGQLLKQGLNSHLWPPEAAAQFSGQFSSRSSARPPGVPLPQVVIAGSVQVRTLGQSPLLQFPKQILLLRHQSLSLAQILKEMNVYSNNDMAQMLADSLGGASAVQQIAATTAGVPQAEIQMVNGSGLGVRNRISPRAICAMLGAIQRELVPHRLSVANLFPVAGQDQRGTLQARHIPANTVIKTGTLNDVSALAGVMPTRDQGLVWFAIINRGSDLQGFRAGQDQLLQQLLKQWRVAPTLPAALISQPPESNPIQLGAASRNEILYRG